MRPWRPVSATASRSGLSMPISLEVSARRRSSSVSSFTLAGTSSTTRTRAVILEPLAAPSGRPQEMTDGLDELADRDRFGQIGLAATLADALLVALHGEGGDRHDRDRLEVGIVLEPFGHFEAGYFRQLDIHQNQIGPVFARQIERLDAVAGADGLVAMRFQQVVEELHIQLVVLYDQDGLRHFPRPICPQRVPRRALGVARPRALGHDQPR